MADFFHDPDIEVEILTKGGTSFKTKEIYSYTSNRSLENPAAQATIIFQGEHLIDPSKPYLKDTKYKDILGLYDLCTVRMRDATGKQWVDIFGFIDPMSPAKAESNGVPANTTQVSVLGLGQAMIQYQIFWHSHLAGRANIAGLGFLARAKGKIPKGRPNEVIEQLFDTFMNDEFVFRLADGRRLNEALVKNFSEFTEGLSTTGLNSMSANGPLWPLLKRYADQPWGELFVDVPRDGIETSLGSLGLQSEALYLRPTPFDLPAWEKLQAPGSGWGFTYKEEDRMGRETLPISTNSVYNFFWVSARSYMSGFDQLSVAFDQSGGKLPIYDKDSIAKIGLRRLEQPTEYVQRMKASEQKGGKMSAAEKIRAGAKGDSWNDLLVFRTEQLRRWYGYPEGYMEGSIPTRGKIGTHPEHGARIGGVLTRERDEAQFYIAGLQQSWTFPGPHITTHQLIRGHDPTKYRDYIFKQYSS